MPAFALPIRRILLFVCAVALLLVPRIGSAEAVVQTDFDGDGQRDQVKLDRGQPKILQVWLSGTGTTDVIRTRRPVLRVIAADLDGDHRPELIARDTSASLHVWKRDARKGFKSYRPRRSLPKARIVSKGKTIGGDPGPGDDPQQFQPGQDLLDSSAPRSASNGRLVHAINPDRPLSVSPSFTPSAPRAPPAFII